MSNYSKMYWLTRLDCINGLFIWLIIVSALTIIIFIIAKPVCISDVYEEEKIKINQLFKKRQWIIKLSVPVLIISVIGITFLPTKNDIIYIYAGGKTMGFIQSDTSINKLPAQTTKIISDYLDKNIKELNQK